MQSARYCSGVMFPMHGAVHWPMWKSKHGVGLSLFVQTTSIGIDTAVEDRLEWKIENGELGIAESFFEKPPPSLSILNFPFSISIEPAGSMLILHVL
jgi:hypothetical protein